MCSNNVPVVDQLVAALDGLTAEDSGTLPDAVLLDRTAGLVAAPARIDAELARTVRRAEPTQAPERDGLRSMASWLRGHCHLFQVAAGRALALAADQAVDLAAIDRTLTDYAAEHAPADTAALGKAYLDRLDPDGPEPDPALGRSCTVVTHPDGRVTGRFDLDPVGGEKVRTVLESFTTADRTAADARTRTQQYGDALVQWADTTLATGSAPGWRGRPPARRRHGRPARPGRPRLRPATAETGFGATLSAARARWAACDADLTRIVLDPQELPLDVGRTHRLVPPWLRRAVEHRDGGCVFTGCTAPSWWCEVHHLVFWALGGETSLANSGLLRQRHHTQAHHGFTLDRDPDGAWHTYRPDGTEILLRTGSGLDPGGGSAEAPPQPRESWALAGAFP